MSLASIVSGIVQKESKVDRKKMAYFFRTFDRFKNQAFSVRILLSLLKPENIIILNTQREFTPENSNVLEYLQDTISAILPDAKVDTVHGIMPGDNTANLVLDEGTTVTKEQMAMVEVGFYINARGYLYMYKGTYAPEGAQYIVEEPTKESMDHYLEQDIDVLLPTENMWLVNELTRNREAEIMICYFGDQPKREIINKVTHLTHAVLESSIKACLHTAYFLEDFKGWDTEKESVQLFDVQYDFVLVIRGDRIDIHLPYDNGAVAKEPNGWLLLN